MTPAQIILGTIGLTLFVWVVVMLDDWHDRRRVERELQEREWATAMRLARMADRPRAGARLKVWHDTDLIEMDLEPPSLSFPPFTTQRRPDAVVVMDVTGATFLRLSRNGMADDVTEEVARRVAEQWEAGRLRAREDA